MFAAITGGAQGIGLAIARRFTAAGWEVALVDRHLCSDRRLQDAQLVVDLTVKDSLAQVVSSLAPRADVLVNAAGIYPVTAALSVTDEEWRAVVELNLTVPASLSREFARQWIADARGGSIINITSTAAVVPRQGISHYASTKAGLNMLSRVLANEWGRHGIRVNCVAPGVIDTPTARAQLYTDTGRKDHTAKLARIPLGRVGRADEVASAVFYLASDEASYITGTTLFVDGGYTCGF